MGKNVQRALRNNDVTNIYEAVSEYRRRLESRRVYSVMETRKPIFSLGAQQRAGAAHRRSGGTPVAS